MENKEQLVYVMCPVCREDKEGHIQVINGITICNDCFEISTSLSDPGKADKCVICDKKTLKHMPCCEIPLCFECINEYDLESCLSCGSEEYIQKCLLCKESNFALSLAHNICFKCREQNEAVTKALDQTEDR